MSYLKNIFTTGAVSKTPSRILKEILAEASLVTHPSLIIELGAGKGEITHQVAEHFNGERSGYFAFEINTQFAEQLTKDYPNVTVAAHDAFHFDDIISIPADLIICSIPLSFFKKSERKVLFAKIRHQLKPGGKCIILFHAFWLIPEIRNVFGKFKLKRFLHLPPYYVASFNKEQI